jgi:hypothetical protein
MRRITRLRGQLNASAYVEDAFHSYLISGNGGAVNPLAGTKATAHYLLEVPGRESRKIRLRLTAALTGGAFSGFEAVFEKRISEADEFYQRITPRALSERSAAGALPSAGRDALE